LRIEEEEEEEERLSGRDGEVILPVDLLVCETNIEEETDTVDEEAAV
jgi:hypothetical protein